MSVKMLKTCGMAGLVVLVAIGLSGCASTVMTAPPSGVSGSFQLDGSGSYEIMGTVEREATVTTIMGLINLPFDSNKAGYVGGGGPAAGGGPLAMIFGPPKDAKARATYLLLEAAGDDADTVIPLWTKVETSGFGIFYKVETATVRGKAIKIK